MLSAGMDGKGKKCEDGKKENQKRKPYTELVGSAFARST